MTNKELKSIIKIFESSSLTRMKLDKGDVKIELEKASDEPTTTQPVQTIKVVDKSQNSTQENTDNPNAYEPINAPLVGTYYEAPAPDQPPFVRPGQAVKKGDTLFIIEAMKVMNEITATRDGKIQAVHVKNGDMVMYDQCIMELE